MKKARLLEERIKRVHFLFKELGYEFIEEQRSPEVFTCDFEDKKRFHGSILIDCNNKFLEIAYSFIFSNQMFHFLKGNLEELMKVCYEFGCYFNFVKSKREISFTIFSKEYFSGLNYYSLRDNLRDFSNCITFISKIIDFEINNASKGG